MAAAADLDAEDTTAKQEDAERVESEQKECVVVPHLDPVAVTEAEVEEAVAGRELGRGSIVSLSTEGANTTEASADAAASVGAFLEDVLAEVGRRVSAVAVECADGVALAAEGVADAVATGENVADEVAAGVTG